MLSGFRFMPEQIKWPKNFSKPSPEIFATATSTSTQPHPGLKPKLNASTELLDPAIQPWIPVNGRNFFDDVVGQDMLAVSNLQDEDLLSFTGSVAQSRSCRSGPRQTSVQAVPSRDQISTLDFQTRVAMLLHQEGLSSLCPRIWDLHRSSARFRVKRGEESEQERSRKTCQDATDLFLSRLSRSLVLRCLSKWTSSQRLEREWFHLGFKLICSGTFRCLSPAGDRRGTSHESSDSFRLEECSGDSIEIHVSNKQL